MVNLFEIVEQIRKLVKEKGHEDTLDSVYKKLLFAFVELAEATDVWKKNIMGTDNKIISPSKETLDKFEEELIDTLFYIMDAYGIVHREFKDISQTPDKVFCDKLAKNFGRSKHYGRPEMVT